MKELGWASIFIDVNIINCEYEFYLVWVIKTKVVVLHISLISKRCDDNRIDRITHLFSLSQAKFVWRQKTWMKEMK